MKDILTVEQMRDAENEAIKNGTDALELMYRAGGKMAEYLKGIIKDKLLVMCGRGNNGGDGFTAAWLLQTEGYEVLIYCPYDASELTEQSRFYFAKCKNVTNRLEMCADFAPNVILDALYGVGFHGRVQGSMLDAVSFINNSGAFVVSADVPSGLGDASVNADVTLCVHAPKINTCCGALAKNCGKLVTVDIGIKESGSRIKLLEKDDINKFLPVRDNFGHKNSFGSVGVVGGCKGMEGAALLSAMAASKSGAGKVSIVSELDFYNRRPAYVMQSNSLSGYGALAFGMGAGRDESAKQILQNVLEQPCHAVIDADGLFAASKMQAEISEINARRTGIGKITVFTPHVGEAALLLGVTPQEVEDDPVSAARSITQRYNCITVLKSWYSVICNDDIFVLNNPESALAKAGSGDCLAGICAAFLAQNALVAGAVMLHNSAGVIAAERFGRASATAEDIISCIKF